MKTPLAGAGLLLALSFFPACAQPPASAARLGAHAPGVGSRRAPAPRAGLAAPSARSAAVLQHDTPYQQVLAQARSSGRPVLLYFWTSW